MAGVKRNAYSFELTERSQMKYLLNLAVLLVTFGLFGCDSNDPEGTDPETEITEVRMVPDSADIEVGHQVDFALVALTAAGDTVHDAALDITWWSTDTTVFTVENDGLAIGHDTGSAWCMADVVELSKSAASLRFTGKDSAFVRVMLF